MTFEDCFSRLTDPRRDGAGWRAVCPSCGGRNLTLRANPANGEPWLHCFNCDASMGELFRAFGEVPSNPRRRLLRAIADPLDEKKRIAKAREMWKASRPAENTLVETYLREYRAIPSDFPIPPTLRFLPQAQAMIAAVTSLDRKVVGVQLTYLDDAGAKADRDPDKQSFGLVRGYAVHLAPVTDTIVLAEGVESALSYMVYYPDSPAWAVLSAYFLKHIILPPSVRTVTIAGDREDRKGTGEDEAAAAAELLEAKYNATVEIEYAPDCCNDWNTFLQRERDAERRLQ